MKSIFKRLTSLVLVTVVLFAFGTVPSAAYAVEDPVYKQGNHLAVDYVEFELNNKTHLAYDYAEYKLQPSGATPRDSWSEVATITTYVDALNSTNIAVESWFSSASGALLYKNVNATADVYVNGFKVGSISLKASPLLGSTNLQVAGVCKYSDGLEKGDLVTVFLTGTATVASHGTFSFDRTIDAIY